jgi:hypothetical protein
MVRGLIVDGSGLLGAVVMVVVVVASAPPGAADPVCDIEHWTADQDGEQVAYFVADQRDPPDGRGLGNIRSVDATTARKAWASIAMTVQRCHEVQRRTWC